MKHVISIDDFDLKQIDELFRLTDKIRKSPEEFVSSLTSKVVATLFIEPSTRTRLSFEAAIHD